MTELDMAILSGAFNRPECPVYVKVPISIKSPLVAKMRIDGENADLPVYLVPISKKESMLYTIIPSTKKDDELGSIVTIDEKEPAKFPGKVSLEKIGDSQIKIQVSGKDFTCFNYNMDNLLRPNFYPLIAPCGEGVTRNWPMNPNVAGETNDHVHHKSCWSAYGDIEGSDFWTDGPLKGKQKVDEIIKLDSNPVFGQITAKISWHSKLGKTLLQEIRDIVVWNTKNIRIMDYTLNFTALTDVKFGDTKEGGFLSVRVASSMDVKGDKGGKIENAFGCIGEKEAWGRRAPWCDYSGMVNDKKVGVAIFEHPSSFQYPTYWHVRNYGLMGANPFGLSHFLGKNNDGSVSLKEGEKMMFKYRLMVHDGDAHDAKLADHYINYYIPCYLVLF